jgi:putative endonuclease
MSVGLLPRFGFALVRWKARRGLREPMDPEGTSELAEKHVAQRTGVRGETYAYWYLRRQGYLFIAKNYAPQHSKGEIDLVAYDGATLVFVEVRTRTTAEGNSNYPEMTITRAKHHVLVRTARYFLRERRLQECPVRFDVVAIDNRPGRPPVLRLHKAALSPKPDS